MRIVTLPSARVVKKSHRHVGLWLLLVVVVSFPTVLYFRPLPPASITITLPKSVKPTSSDISWPSGQAAFSAEGFDFLESNQADSKISTASIAKVITALCVLERKPLKLGEAGPTLTMGSEDVQRYQLELARDGTTFAVAEGDKLTEYEILQAILLPSANNIADSAAIWAFGSLNDYRAFAQNYVQSHNMTATTIGPDASGYDPSTTSTPSDLVKLAKIALKNSVIMEITGKPTATIGNDKVINNHNIMVGKDGITGLKTGRNDENSGGLLFTANVGEGSHTVKVAGIVTNAGSLSAALVGTAQLVVSLQKDFPVSVVAAKNSSVGSLHTAWGTTTSIVALNDVALQHWAGSAIYEYHDIRAVSGTRQETIGTIYAKADGRKSSAAIGVATPAAAPTIFWRITHIR